MHWCLQFIDSEPIGSCTQQQDYLRVALAKDDFVELLVGMKSRKGDRRHCSDSHALRHAHWLTIFCFTAPTHVLRLRVTTFEKVNLVTCMRGTQGSHTKRRRRKISCARSLEPEADPFPIRSDVASWRLIGNATRQTRATAGKFRSLCRDLRVNSKMFNS